MKKQLQLLDGQVKDAVNCGATMITGQKPNSKNKGAYYPLTLLTKINTNMRVWNEEVFGPVLPIITFKTEEEAIHLANCSMFGLGAIIFSNDKIRAQRVASKLKAGTVEINSAMHWNPSNPFGGYKKSGIGREHGIHGFRELCQIKVISKEK